MLYFIFNLLFKVYSLLEWFPPSSLWLVGGGIVVEYFGYGFGFVGLTLFMMQQVQQQEAVIAGSFHDVVMLSDSKRTDELTHSRSGVRKSLNTATVR